MDNQVLLLVKRACAHDHDAFVKLCETKARYVMYFCQQYMNNSSDAEDAAQEVFIRMQRKIGQLNQPEAFNTWLNKLLVSTCTDMRRKMMKDMGNISVEDSNIDFVSETLESLPEEYIETADLRKSIVDMVRALPDKYKECVLLYYYQNLNYAQTAAVLDITPDAVQHNLKMARKHLKVELEEKVESWKQANTPMLAISPALNAILNRSAQEAIVPSAMYQCLEAAGVYAAFLSGGAVAAGAAGTSITAFFGGPLFKSLLGAIAATTVAVTVLFSSASAPVPANVLVVSDPQRLPQTGNGYEDTVSILDAGIPNVPAPAQNNSVPDAGTFTPEAGVAESPTGGSATASAGAQQPAAESTPAAVPPAPAAAAEKAPLLKGSVEFKKANGTVIPDGGKYAKDFVATLKQEEDVVMRTTVDATGQYAFYDIALKTAGQYTIEIAPPSSRGAALAAENPVGSLTVQLEPGAEAPATVAPTLYITDTGAPEVNILLLDQNNQPDPVNPAQAAITIEDETGTTCRWQIMTANGAQVLYSGSGTSVSAPFAAMAAAGQKGRFILKVTATDAAGNSTEVQQAFYIV